MFSKIKEEELAKKIEETDQNIAKMEKVILNVSDIISEAIVQSATVPNDTLNSSMSRETKKTVRAKLPKLEVKKFGGKLQGWQEFWDSFDSTANQNEDLVDVDKFASYLNDSTLWLKEAKRLYVVQPVTGLLLKRF